MTAYGPIKYPDALMDKKIRGRAKTLGLSVHKKRKKWFFSKDGETQAVELDDQEAYDWLVTRKAEEK